MAAAMVAAVAAVAVVASWDAEREAARRLALHQHDPRVAHGGARVVGGHRMRSRREGREQRFVGEDVDAPREPLGSLGDDAQHLGVEEVRPVVAGRAKAEVHVLADLPRRQRRDLIARRTILAATILALIPLVLIVYYLLKKGLSAWSGDFFTTDPNGNFLGYPGGVRSAILGTIEIVALASLISIPIGIGVALYLTEYGKESWFANVVRYFVDVMTGVPSIVGTVIAAPSAASSNRTGTLIVRLSPLRPNSRCGLTWTRM